MKIFIASIIISIFGLSFKSFKNMNDKDIKETFQYVNEMGLSNYIVINTTKDSINGVYYGVEFNLDTTLIYFKSHFNVLKKDSEISFKLEKFYYSYEPFYLNSPNNNLITNKSKIPFIVSSSVYFSGHFLGNILQLRRITDFYDSKSDEMLFLKIQE